jgi:hypothetical protein
MYTARGSTVSSLPDICIEIQKPFCGARSMVCVTESNINRAGELGQSLEVPDIDYSEPIEERENKVYADISNNMAGYAKLMFGMPQK